MLGVSGRAMLKALSEGEEDPKVLAELARGRLREKREELEEALRGLMGPHQRFMLTIQLDHLNSLDRRIETLDLEVARRVDPFEETVAAVDTIPGIGRRTAEVIVAEMGTDMSRSFPVRVTWLPGRGCVRGTIGARRSISGLPPRRATAG